MHGGGTRCQVNGCDKSRQTGGNCSGHGGGSRCSVRGCEKVSQGGGKYCEHGGGAQCQVNGCNKLDKSGGKCCGHASGRSCQVVGCLRQFCQRVIRADADGVQHHIKIAVSKRQEPSDDTTHASQKRKAV